MKLKVNEGLLYIFLAVTGYAFLPTIVKQIYATNLPELDIAIWRFGLATPLFWLVIWLRRGSDNGEKLPQVKLMAMGVLLAAAGLTAFFGLARIPASTYVLLFYSYPVMVAVFSALIGWKVPSRIWLALPLTVVGLVLTVPNFSEGLQGTDFIGVLLAIINAVVVAVYFMLNSRLLRGYTDVARGSAWAITGAFVVIALLVIVRGVIMPQGIAWVYLFLLASFCTVMPVFMLTAGIQKLGAARASIFSMLEPVLGLVLAFLLLGENLYWIQLVGGALILVSVILLQIPSKGTAVESTPETQSTVIS
jgi:drug/metabolite transporter (DMT)-like permease